MNRRRSTVDKIHAPDSSSDATVTLPRRSEGPSAPPSMSAELDVKPRVSQPPEEFHELFNEGDMILKSSDGVKFRVYSLVLRLSSSVLEAMLERIEESSGGVQEDIVLPLDEEAAVIVNALIMTSGKAFPADMFGHLDTIEPLAKFCDKYDMQGLLSIIRSSITHSTLIDSHPLRIHALASMYKWEGVAQASALRCLDFDLTAPETIAGLRGISLDDYTRLLSLAKRRQSRFRQLLYDPGVFHASSADFACPHCKTPFKDPAWRILRLELEIAFADCTSGLPITRNLDRWDSWVTAMRAFHCRGSPLYDANSTYAAILKAIENLPGQLKNDRPSS